ncbi:alpha 1,2 mannosyltransferase [Diaporthe eres]
MWRRTYLFLLVVRLWFALSPSYLHPDENFQGPEVIAVRLPHQRNVLRVWTVTWIVFNLIFGTLMGIYHQGGIVPAQVFMSKQPDATRAIWWKTYMPPIWLLDGKAETLETRDVMGMPGEDLYAELTKIATCDVPADRRNQEYKKESNGTYLIAPTSATWLDPYLENKGLDD